MTEAMLLEKEKIFFCATPAEFVGLKRDALQRLQQNIKATFSKQVSLDSFFHGLHELTESTSASSYNAFSSYTASAETDLQD